MQSFFERNAFMFVTIKEMLAYAALFNCVGRSVHLESLEACHATIVAQGKTMEHIIKWSER